MSDRHFVFEDSDQVTRSKVRFKNRFGIELAGDLYRPVDSETANGVSLVVAGPFGAVKEQTSGLYAQQLALRGFTALAFDPSYTGESGGQARDVASPEMFTEDFSAAVDYLGAQDDLNRERIGAMAICGLSGMALTAVSIDLRIKAVAISAMYDMSRSIGEGLNSSMSVEEHQNFLKYLAQERWNVVDNGKTRRGPHEPGFSQDHQVIAQQEIIPEELPENPHPVLAVFHDYYKTPRGFHENSVNSTSAWESRTPLSFMAFPQYVHLENISPRPVMFVTGDKAHSRYFSEEAYQRLSGPKELVVMPDTDHVDLYDQLDKIPFDRIAAFFEEGLKA